MSAKTIFNQICSELSETKNEEICQTKTDFIASNTYNFQKEYHLTKNLGKEITISYKTAVIILIIVIILNIAILLFYRWYIKKRTKQLLSDESFEFRVKETISSYNKM